MEELLSMGFSEVLAAEALKATAGDILKATDWILTRTSSHQHPSTPSPPPPHEYNNTTTSLALPTHNPSSASFITAPSSTLCDIHRYSPPPPSPPPPDSSSPIFQPKIDRFFHFQPKPKPMSQIVKEEDKQQVHINHYNHSITDISNDESEQADFLFQEPTRKRPRLLLLSGGGQKGPSPPPPPPLPSGEPELPLYERMRPRTLDDVVGQDHILGPNSALRSAIECTRLPSMVLWGPPGTGKTSIARAILNSNSSASTTYRFVSLSAVNSGVKEVRDAVDQARKWKTKLGGGHRRRATVLFIDEVHRFNKAQQDSLLPVIEDGSIVFIGATSENPSFHLITPLLSRCTLLVLNPLKPHHITTLLNRALLSDSSTNNNGLSLPSSSSFGKIEVEDKAIEFLSANSDGDARVALNALENSATIAAASATRLQGGLLGGGGSNTNSKNVLLVTLSHVKEACQCKHIAYDRDGEEHYNLISALHKSMRGSDADASIYWLARMLEGGEQPLYIARRLIRFASEDVGLADPSALTQAVACYQACHFIGMPECNVNLAQCVTYLALAPKSVSVYKAFENAQNVVRESVGQNEGVPLHLRNAPTKLMKDVGYGKGYVYPPDNPNSLSQTYMPPSLQGYKFLHWPNAPESG